jgi:PAS domain S-box-containing protein
MPSLLGFARRPRKAAPEEQAAALLRAIVEGTTDVIFVRDLEGRYLLINTAGAQLLAGEAQLPLEADRWVAMSGEVQTSEEILTVGGRPRTYLTTRGPYRDDQGAIVGVVAIARDITERKGLEDALTDLYDNAPDMFGSVEAPSNCLRQCNRALTQATGYDKQEILGRSVLELHQLDCLEDLQKALDRLFQTGEVRNVELRLRRKDGGAVDVSLNASAVRDAQGRFLHGRFVWRDITERKLAERRMRQISGRLLRLQDEERRRIARELHDTTAQNLAALKIALTRVADAAGLLPGDREVLEQSIALTDECAREIRTMSYLLHPPLLDELGLAHALKAYVKGYTQRTGVAVELEVAADLGRLARDSETALFRIVQEALANIHRHSGSPTARISLERDNGRVALRVQDEGCGLPPGLLERGAVRLGVGISGMRERARQLGGSLEIHSRQAGTTVEAILPVEEEPS